MVDMTANLLRVRLTTWRVLSDWGAGCTVTGVNGPCSYLTMGPRLCGLLGSLMAEFLVSREVGSAA